MVCLVVLITIPAVHAVADSPPVMTDQGPLWTPAARKEFYSRDQGSQIMPLRWMAALKQANGDKGRASDLLQINFKTLAAKLRQYGMD